MKGEGGRGQRELRGKEFRGGGPKRRERVDRKSFLETGKESRVYRRQDDEGEEREDRTEGVKKEKQPGAEAAEAD